MLGAGCWVLGARPFSSPNTYHLTPNTYRGAFMSDKARRKQLTDDYKSNHPEAGVYRIVNTQTGRALLGSAVNLPSVRSKLAFARSTNTSGGLDHRLTSDMRQYGPDAFDLEILEVLDTRPEMTQAEIRDDLTTLEALWREKLDPASLY